MFLVLTDINKTNPVYLNSNEIVSFETPGSQSEARTLINLHYGNILVRERPEEIYEMLKGNN